LGLKQDSILEGWNNNPKGKGQFPQGLANTIHTKQMGTGALTFKNGLSLTFQVKIPEQTLFSKIGRTSQEILG